MTATAKTKPRNEKWYNTGIVYLLYVLAALVPAVFHPAFYTAFSAPKLLVLRLLTLAAVFLWGFKIFVERRFSYRKSWLNVLLAVYGLLTVASTVFSMAFYTSLYGAHGRFLGLFTVLNLLLLPFLVMNFLHDREKIMKLLTVSFFVSGILALYGILQHFGVWQEQFNWNQDPADRVFGTIGHGNHFGAYLGMNLVLGFFMLKEFKNRGLRYAAYLALAVHAVTIFLTASRGAIIAVAVSFLMCGLVIAFRKKQKGELNAGKWLVPVFVVVGILAGGTVIFKDELVKIPLIERTAITIESISQGKIPDRYSWWLSAAEMIKDRPLLGYGLSTFRDIYNDYRRLDYETVEEGDQEAHITPEAAHNEYLTIGAAQGLLGLLAWILVVLYVSGKINGRLLEEDEKTGWYTLLGLKGALIVYLVQVFFSFGVISTMTVFYLYLGSAIVLAAPGLKERSVDFAAGKLVAVKTAVKYLLVLIMIGLAGAGTVLTLREAGADYYYKAALAAGAGNDVEGVFNYFESSIALMPHEYAYRQAMGDYALQAAQPVSATETRFSLLGRAADAYSRALEINAYHPSVYYNLGVAQLQLYALGGQQDYYDDAVKNMEEAIARSPNNPLYPYQAGKAFMMFDDSKSRYNATYHLLESLEIREHYRDAEQLLEQLTGKKLTPAGMPDPEAALVS